MAVKALPPAAVAHSAIGEDFNGGAWTNGSLNTPRNNFYSGLTELIGVKAIETVALPATAVNFRNDRTMHGSMTRALAE